MTKYINSKQYRREIDKACNDHIMLFLGPEEGEKEKTIRHICSLEFRDSSEQKNSVSRFRIESDELLAAADFSLASSIFYARKICVIYNIDLLANNKNNILLLTDMLENTPLSTKIIMTSQHNAPPAVLKAGLLSSIRTIQFWKHFDSDMFHYITMTFKSKGYSIDRETCRYLLEQTGNDIKKIDDAIDMIDNFAETQNISVEHIKALVPDVKDITIFDFLDSLFNRHCRSLHDLKTLLNNGTPDLLILNMILKQLETIEKYMLLTDNGISFDEALKQCGIYTKKINTFKQYLQNFPRSKLKQIMPVVSNTDLQLKSKKYSKNFMANPLIDLVACILVN